MAHYQTTVTTSAAPETVFAYLADFRTLLEWDPSAVEVDLTAGEPGEVGARYQVVVGLPPLVVRLEYDTLTCLPPAADNGVLELRAENADVISHDVITFVPLDGGGCEVTYDAELQPKGYRRLFEPVFGVMMQIIGSRASVGLRRELTALPVPQG